MQILDTESLKKKVDRLREQGVIIPSAYPPLNLEASSEWFRGCLGEVEVLELLIGVFAPHNLELKLRSDVGDVDIEIHSKPAYLLQVKDLSINTIRPTEDDEPLELEKVISSVINKAEEDIKASNWGGGVFANLRVHMNNDKVLAMSGDSVLVKECNKRLHMYVIEVDPAIYETSLRLKLEKCINKAYSQLRDHKNNEIIVPVLNMKRYPHNQAVAYKALKELFKAKPGWTEIGGVLMITNDYCRHADSSGFHHIRTRLIGIENQNANKERKLELYRFNPNLDDEDIHEENRIIFHPIPCGTPFEIRGNDVFVDGIRFGSTPWNLSYPTDVRFQSESISK